MQFLSCSTMLLIKSSELRAAYVNVCAKCMCVCEGERAGEREYVYIIVFRS